MNPAAPEETCPEALKPCPFCGHAAEHGNTYRNGKFHASFVYCTHCPMATPWRPTVHEAVAIWNLRI